MATRKAVFSRDGYCGDGVYSFSCHSCGGGWDTTAPRGDLFKWCPRCGVKFTGEIRPTGGSEGDKIDFDNWVAYLAANPE
jgi:hypothetical protein